MRVVDCKTYQGGLLARPIGAAARRQQMGVAASNITPLLHQSVLLAVTLKPQIR